jgi:hypothetical protein
MTNSALLGSASDALLLAVVPLNGREPACTSCIRQTVMLGVAGKGASMIAVVATSEVVMCSIRAKVIVGCVRILAMPLVVL